MAVQMIGCPACKKKISVEAQTCPHCGQPIDDKHRERELREIKAGKMGCFVLIALVIGFIIFIVIFSDDKPSQTLTQASSPPVQNDPVATSLNQTEPVGQAENEPKAAPLAQGKDSDEIDIVYYSDKRMAEKKQREIEKTESQELEEFEVKAKHGDYQAQRNTAWIYSTSKDPFVSNKLLGCAWYKLILLSGSPQVGDGDIGNVQTYCGRLTSAQQLVTEQQAMHLYHEIYEGKSRKKPRGKP